MMALEPSLWRTLPEELLHLVFAHLHVAGIGQLRVLLKEWKWNIDCKHSEFNRFFNATTHFKMFALMSWPRSLVDEASIRLYDVQANKWHGFKNNTDYKPIHKAYAIDGGLFCCPWKWENTKWYLPIVVVNPLTQRKKKLPPLLHMGSEEFSVQVRMVKLTMDKKTKEYKVHIVGYMKTDDNNRLFAQVYDSHVNGWSMVESREGCIIGWDLATVSETNIFYPVYWPCVYNCVDKSLQHFSPSKILPGLTVYLECIQLINDHIFVLHREDGESISKKYCISEFHLPEKATSWVKLVVHKCDPSICSSLEKDYTLSLVACNGFLLVHSGEFGQKYDRGWLYNLSTCTWHNLPDYKLPYWYHLVMCEMNWSVLP